MVIFAVDNRFHHTDAESFFTEASYASYYQKISELLEKYIVLSQEHKSISNVERFVE